MHGCGNIGTFDSFNNDKGLELINSCTFASQTVKTYKLLFQF